MAALVNRFCGAWIAFVVTLFFVVVSDVDNVMVQDGQLDRLLFWTRLGALFTLLCAIRWVWSRHQASAPTHFGKLASQYVLAASVFGLLGGSTVYMGLPRASLLLQSSAMSVTDTLYKVALDRRANRTVRRRYLTELGDRIFEHPNNEIYDLYLDHYFDPYLRRQQVSVSHRHGEKVFPRGRGGPANPKTVLLHGVGNGFAMRVFDFTVLEPEHDA